jgi:hypothetical protein
MLYVLASFLVRWRCCLCDRTFRHYPEGVVPFKRYLFTALASLCTRYLREPAATYRRVAHCAGPEESLPAFYDQPVAKAEDSEAQKRRDQPTALSHVTVWRWVGFFGNLGPQLRRRIERQQALSDAVDFSPWRIPPWKYRSLRRRVTLIEAAKVLTAMDLGRSPTNLGTLYAGP